MVYEGMWIDYKVHVYKTALLATEESRTRYELEMWETVEQRCMRIDYKVRVHKMALLAPWESRTRYELEM